jgi:hypothetical protein
MASAFFLCSRVVTYRRGKTDSADGLSRKPDYKAAAEGEDHRKKALTTKSGDCREAQQAQSDDCRREAEAEDRRNMTVKR